MKPEPEAAAARAAELRRLPKADRLLAAVAAAGLVRRWGHEAVMQGVRGVLDEIRAEVMSGGPCPDVPVIERRLLAHLERAGRASLRRVINATGIVVHTNLGRAPLSEAALAAMRELGAGYSNLEYDLERGERGDRYGHAAEALCRLTGAEAAVVVNNNAGSVLVALAALCGAAPRRTDPAAPPRGDASEEATAAGLPEVIISRGQLVEIGGGFRIPDVLRRSGAALVEVGTTNRTYAHDYEAAVGPRTRMLLSVHRSNFRLSGFVHDASPSELVDLGRRHGLWVMDDLGSGTLLDTRRFGLSGEPTVQERVAAGADVVCFSGDKLLGGPQAGLLVGRAEAIGAIRRHPLLRALRVDKMTLAALAATLAHYERGEAEREVPVWRAIAQDADALHARARAWAAALAGTGRGVATVRESVSAVGGGSLPGVTLPTFVLALAGRGAERVAARLRAADPPVVARIEDDSVLLDPRTVAPDEDEALVAALRWALADAPDGAAR